MTKLNNKGFAITGILYTLFVLFLLILVSVLGGLSSKKNLLEQSITSLEDSYLGTVYSKDEYINSIKVSELEIAPVDGRYKFSCTIDEVEYYDCYSYLKKGDNINDSILIPNDFNNSNVKRELQEVTSFEER